MDRGTCLNGKPTPTCNGCRPWAGGSVIENLWAKGKVRLLTGAHLTTSNYTKWIPGKWDVNLKLK
jgi:hypothetical protein